MELTEEQKAEVTRWVKEGCGLSEIQSRLTEQFKLTPTFMDVRFLVLDLELVVEDKPSRFSPPAREKKEDALSEDSPVEDMADLPESAVPGGLGGLVTVSLDRVTRPGSVVSGTVRFSDGVSATWFLDQMGRLALSAEKEGYSPSEEDVQMFQEELKKALQKRGF